jgi:hypothetical protein
MKKLFGLFATLLLSFSLAACGGGTVLADANHDYYVTGNFAGWGSAIGNPNQKMEAVAIGDSRIGQVRNQLNNATAIYVLEIELPATLAGGSISYKINGVKTNFDDNLTVKVIQTMTDDDVPNYWAQNPESGKVTSLTPTTLYIPPFVDENIDDAGSWNDNPVVTSGPGKYTLVFAIAPGSKFMGAIKD